MRRFAALATAVLAGAALLGSTTPAHASSGNCDEDGTYYCWQTSFSWGSIRMATTIHSDDHHEYASAKASSNAPAFQAYLDRSSDGGKTWEGWIAAEWNIGNSTLWTPDPGVGLYDGPPYVSRACINVNGVSGCTPWH
ncbi:hypothetical protein GCM10029978_047890 [Actinoallomurus acanthiterrae]